jgi:hypothetical protein
MKQELKCKTDLQAEIQQIEFNITMVLGQLVLKNMRTFRCKDNILASHATLVQLRARLFFATLTE